MCLDVSRVVSSVSYKFGVVSMVSGIMGVPAGSFVAQHLRHRFPRIDAHLCGIGLLLSTPMVFAACLSASYSLTLCLTFVFFGEFFLNLTWSIVADILLVRSETRGRRQRQRLVHTLLFLFCLVCAVTTAPLTVVT
jgi:hypothetical protein